MTPILRNPLTGEPVLMAPSRASRPHDVGLPEAADGCPFCAGNEAQTPPEVFADRAEGTAPDAPGWRVRAFANLYPALAPDEGAHEVIVNSPRHVGSLGDLTDDEASRAVAVWGRRLDSLARDPRGPWPFLFLNQGAAAGASLQHSHAQLIGLPFDPPRLVALEAAFAATDRCPICADIEEVGARIVATGEGLVAWCPAVPPLSGAVRVAPVAHQPDWEAALDAGALGRMLRHQARRIADVSGNDALNLWLNQRRPGGMDRFHWHVDLLPRTEALAGLELGAGVVALTQTPDASAARLRALGIRPNGTSAFHRMAPAACLATV